MKHSPLWIRSVAPLALAAASSAVGFASANQTLPNHGGANTPATLADLAELRRDIGAALADVRRDFYANMGIGSLAGLGVAGGLAASAERRAAKKGESPR